MNVPIRLALLILLVVVLAAGLVWRLTTVGDSSGNEPEDPDAARIEQLKVNRDLAALAKEATGPKVEVAQRALEAMAYIGPEAAPQIRQVIKDSRDLRDRDDVRESAVVALGRVSARVPPPVDIETLAGIAREDGSENVRAAAVSALGAMHAFEELETLLSRMEHDKSEDVQRRSAAAVIRIIGEDVGFKAGESLKERQEAIERIRAVWRKDGERIRQYWTLIRNRGGRL